jgi:hypothetical protein
MACRGGALSHGVVPLRSTPTLPAPRRDSVIWVAALLSALRLPGSSLGRGVVPLHSHSGRQNT